MIEAVPFDVLSACYGAVTGLVLVMFVYVVVEAGENFAEYMVLAMVAAALVWIGDEYGAFVDWITMMTGFVVTALVTVLLVKPETESEWSAEGDKA